MRAIFSMETPLMRDLTPLPILFLVAGLALPAVATTYETDHDADANFSTYETFAWKEVQPESDDARIARSDLVVKRARKVIEDQLRTKGLSEATNADLHVEFRVQLRNRLDFDETGGLRGSRGVFLNDNHSGTAIVDLIDGSTGKLVWRGWAHELIRDGRTAESRIRRGMEKLLRHYPPRKD